MTETRESPATSPFLLISNIVTLIVGLAVGRHTGLYLLAPLTLAVVIGLPYAKFSRGKRRAVAVSFAVHAGMAIWVLYCLLTLKAPAPAFLFIFDLLALGAGTLWLLVAPELLPVLILLGYQFVFMIVNAFQIARFDFAAESHQILAVQIIVRLLSMVVLAIAIRSLQKLTTADLTANPLASA